MRKHWNKPHHAFVPGQRVRDVDGYEGEILRAHPYADVVWVSWKTGPMSRRPPPYCYGVFHADLTPI